MKRLLSAFVLFLVAAVFPAEVRAADTLDMTKARKEIEEANRIFCEVLHKGDAAAVAKFFTEDGKSMGPNGPAAVGREKIQALYAEFIADGATVLDLDVERPLGNGSADGGGRYSSGSRTRRERNSTAGSTWCLEENRRGVEIVCETSTTRTCRSRRRSRPAAARESGKHRTSNVERRTSKSGG